MTVLSQQQTPPAPEAQAESSAFQVEVMCPACDVPFDPVTSTGEAEFLAGVHNQLQHGGSTLAHTTTPPAAADDSTLGLGWTSDPEVTADAQGQAFAFAGERTAAEAAWSARVQAAVNGMDVLDPAGMD